MQKIIFSIVLLFASVAISAQQTIKAKNISLLAYNDNYDIDFYKKVGKDKYQDVYLQNDDDKSKDYGEIETVHLFFETDGETKTLEELKQKYKTIVFVKDIRPTKFADFEGKTFEWKLFSDEEKEKNTITKNKNEEKYEDRTIVQFLSKHLCKKEDLEFRDRSYYGFGAYETREVDTLKRWRPVDNEYFTPLVMDFGNGRKIYLFNDEEDIEMFLLPLKNSNLFVDNEEGMLTKIEQITNRYEKFWGYRAEKFLAVRPKGKKQELVNVYDKKVLKKSYDTLLISNRFVIGKNKKSVDIYDASLNKLNFGKVKNAYPYRSGLEILNQNGASYYNADGKPVSKISITYSVCGTVSRKKYIIQKDSLSSIPYRMFYKYSSPYGYSEKRNFIFADRTTDEELSFLDGKINFHWDGNSDFVGQMYVKPTLIRVKKGDKYGVFKYNYKEKNEPYQITKQKRYFEEEEARLYKDKTLYGTPFLPIEYTHIVLKDGFLFIEKDGKIGIYPYHKTPIYDKITPITKNFYEVVKNGKKLWLDVSIMKEFD